MIEELNDFAHHSRVERRLAPLTCQAYDRDVRACWRFMQGAIGSWRQVGLVQLRRFLAAEADHRPAPASQARTVAALKGFFRFLVENEAIERNPAGRLRTPWFQRLASRWQCCDHPCHEGIASIRNVALMNGSAGPNIEDDQGSSTEGAEMRAIDCPCGHRLQGEDDEELVRKAREHIDREHPEMERTDEELRARVAADAYDDVPTGSNAR